MPRPRRSEEMIVRIARMRYEQRLPQNEIAKALDISESTVSRSLKTALDLGYVEIQVAPKAFRDLQMERRLKLHLGLKFAVVVEDRSAPAQSIDALGKALARVLEDMLKPGDVVGVSDGATVAAVAAASRRGPTTDIDVVSLVGGLGAPEQTSHSSEVCRRLASGLGARAWQLPVPAIVDDETTARVLHETGTIRGVFGMMRRMSIALVGVGAMTTDATIFREGFIDESFLAEMQRRGAVGTICARFFGARGQPVGTPFDERTLSVSLADLSRVPLKIAAAVSTDKAAAIRAAIDGGLVNAVATDSTTALALMGLTR